MIKNFFGHIHTVNLHRWEVFKISIKLGIPIRGLFHDLSKYSIEELRDSVKYYTGGTYSPLLACKNATGYSNHGYIIKVETNIIMSIGMIQQLLKVCQ